MVVDTNKNVYIACRFFDAGNVQVGNNLFDLAGATNSILAKLSADGTVVWSKHLCGETVICSDMLLDHDGNLIVTGTSTDGADLLGARIFNGVPSNLFLIKADGDGNRFWATAIGATESTCAAALAVDESNNVLVTASFSGVCALPTLQGYASLVSASGTSALVARYTSVGDLDWLKDIGDGQVKPVSMARDDAGALYVAGACQAISNFGTTNLDSGSTGSAYLAKLDVNGNVSKVWQVSGATSQESFAVRVSGTNIFWGINLTGAATFGTHQLLNTTNANLYVLRFNETDSTVMGVRSAGSSTFGINLAATDDDFTVVGQFGGTNYFGGRFVSSGDTDAFIARFGTNGFSRWTLIGKSTGADSACAVSYIPSTKTFFIGGSAGSGFSLAGQSLGDFTSTRAFVSRLEFPAPIKLSIVVSGRYPKSGFAQLSWPASPAGFTLQVSNDPQASVWHSAPTTFGTDGTNNGVALFMDQDYTFFRLIRP